MDDPRNIFVTQRQNYAQPPESKGHNQQPTEQSGAPKQPTSGAQTTTPSADAQSDYEQKVAEMKRLAEKYQREGEGQLVKDILNTVIEQKARGQLTNDQLVTFAKRISPMLNADQRERLNQLVEQLLKL